MPRLAPVDPPYAPEIEELLASMMPPGVPPIALFRTLVHDPRIARKLHASNLLDRGALGLRQRELAILRTTARFPEPTVRSDPTRRSGPEPAA